ncbi:Hypothetical predicted protein [Podarcis lilfordi]|uniref:Uncharacterized protein n=1 Tax=Podarcis lilfordi TaxID=74358 RepID=A0AA35NYG6_9SAUR|nr:Hypothetical predicted protein [Podarcis lilfordi]
MGTAIHSSPGLSSSPIPTGDYMVKWNVWEHISSSCWKSWMQMLAQASLKTPEAPLRGARACNSVMPWKWEGSYHERYQLAQVFCVCVQQSLDWTMQHMQTLLVLVLDQHS